MYCGQCGKRVLDDMLFCPFCGAPIVIPEQDAPKSEPEVSPASAEPEPANAEPASAEPAPVSAEPAPVSAEPQGAEPAPEGGEEVPPPSPVAEDEPEPQIEFESEPEPQAEPEDEPFEPLRFDDVEGAEPEAPAEEAAPHRPASLFDGENLAGETEGSAGEDIDGGEGASPVREEAPRRSAPRRSAPRRQSPARSGQRSNKTFIPVRDVDPEDMFMDSTRPSPDDGFDPYDGEAEDGGFGDDFSFEEPEPEGFVQRHIRGVVGLLLLLALLVIFVIWAAMPKGQRVLATANLAWSAQVYNDLGYEAYEAGQFDRAAQYFERALARDGDNYDYAHSAMVAYYEAEDTSSALAMLKRCIDMKPDSADPYLELLILYPDPASRPWDVQQLLRQGYERTGEASLNAAGG